MFKQKHINSRPIDVLNQAILALCAVGLTGCGTSHLVDPNELGSQVAGASSNQTSQLQIVSNPGTVNPVSELQFEVEGGQPPYKFALYTGPNDSAIDENSGVLKTGNQVGAAVISVTDSLGKVVYRDFTIVHQALTMGLSTSQTYFNSGVNQVFSFINAIDGASTTAFATPASTSNANSGGIYLAAWPNTKTASSVSAVFLKASMVNGQPSGFPTTYEIYLTTPNNSEWMPVQNYTVQPDGNGNVLIQLPQVYSTYGILLKPSVFGACVVRAGGPCSSGGQFDFEMAEISIGN